MTKKLANSSYDPYLIYEIFNQDNISTGFQVFLGDQACEGITTLDKACEIAQRLNPADTFTKAIDNPPPSTNKSKSSLGRNSKRK